MQDDARLSISRLERKLELGCRVGVVPESFTSPICRYEQVQQQIRNVAKENNFALPQERGKLKAGLSDG